VDCPNKQAAFAPYGAATRLIAAFHAGERKSARPLPSRLPLYLLNFQGFAIVLATYQLTGNWGWGENVTATALETGKYYYYLSPSRYVRVFLY
jgi:hypothetical protein